MSMQSFLAKNGLRLGTLGTAASLAIAAPLAEGNYDPAASTDPTRTGMYFDLTPGAAFIGMVVDGGEKFRVTENGLQADDGLAAAPAYSFLTDPTTGIYMSGAGELDFAVAGNQKAWIDATFFELFTGSSYFDYSFSTGGVALVGASTLATESLLQVLDQYATSTTEYAMLVQSRASNGLYVHSQEFAGSGQIALRTLSQFGSGVALSAETAGGAGTAAVIEIIDGRATLGLSIDASGAGAALFIGTSLNPVAVNPGGTTTLWANSGDGDALYYGGSPVGGGGGTPGGSPGEFQFNDSGSFGGVYTSQFDNGTGAITFSGWGSPSVAVTFTADNDDVFDELVVMECGSGQTGGLTLLRLNSANTNNSIGLDIIMANATDQAILATGGNVTINGGFLEVTEDTTGPGLRGLAQTTTGIRWTSTPSLEFIASNVTGMSLTSTGLTVNVPVTWAGQLQAADGSLGAPAYSFSSTPTMGMYRASASTLGFGIGGTARLSVSTAGAAVVGAFSATTTITATTAFRADPGSNTVPGYGFTGETNTGMYRSAAGTLSFTSLGTQSMTITTTAISPLLVITGTSGSATAPPFSFSGDPNSGVYSVGADSVGISAGGTGRFFVDTASIRGSLQIQGPNGSAAAPSFSFTAETTKGMYAVGSNTIGFSTASTLRFSISNTTITSALPLDMGGLNLTNYTIGTVTVAATTLTLQASNASTYAGRYVIFTSGSGCTVSINSDLPAGFNMVFEQNGAGTITFAAGTGTVVNRQSFLSTAGQYAIGSLVCRTAGNAVLAGDLA